MTKTYGSVAGEVRPLSEVTFELTPRDVVAVSGPSGSGKDDTADACMHAVPAGWTKRKSEPVSGRASLYRLAHEACTPHPWSALIVHERPIAQQGQSLKFERSARQASGLVWLLAPTL